MKPDFVEASLNLGLAFKDMGRWREAAAHFHQALRLQPNLAEAHNDLGATLLELGEIDQAVAGFREAIRLRPGYAQAHNNLGIAWAKVRKFEEAVASYREALRLNPDLAEVHLNLGAALQEKREPVEAAVSLRHALRLRPNLVEAHLNLAAALQDQDRIDEAIEHCREALRLRPESAEAHVNLAAARHSRGELDEALASYEDALRLNPDLAEAHKGRALAWLQTGDFDRGWPAHEWRWKESKAQPRPFRQPLWDGSPLAGRTILLHAEQGLGDILQFIRYATLVKPSDGKVLVACPRSLDPLLATCSGVDELVGMGPDFPPFDVHAPLMSLPGLLKTTLSTIPCEVPYLSADPDLVRHWRQELGEVPGFKVGIAWQGSRTYRGDRRPIPTAGGLRAHRPRGRGQALQPAERPRVRAGGRRRRELAADRPGPCAGREHRGVHGHGRGHEEPRPGHHLGHGDRPPGRGAGRSRLGGPLVRPRMALALPGRQPLVSHDAPVPPTRSGELAGRLRAHGGGAGVALTVWHRWGVGKLIYVRTNDWRAIHQCRPALPFPVDAIRAVV